MSYIGKTFLEDIELPDGTRASSYSDIEKYLKKEGLAMADDYSQEFRENIKRKQQKEERAELFALFLKNYKRSIWK